MPDGRFDIVRINELVELHRNTGRIRNFYSASANPWLVHVPLIVSGALFRGICDVDVDPLATIADLAPLGAEFYSPPEPRPVRAIRMPTVSRAAVAT